MAGTAVGGRPVFTDHSGRRPRRMKQAGLVLCAAMLACVVVMAASLLGGPGASVIPWGAVKAGPSAGPARSVQASPRPVPALSARPPSTRAGAGRSPVGAATGGSAAPSAGGSQVPVVTNRASKTPPGRNRTARPAPSRRVSAA